MRWLLLILLLISAALFGGYTVIKGYPYRLYSQWALGKEWNKFYSIMGYKKLYLAPVEIEPIPPYKEDYAQLWREFPLVNTKVPFPVRHPLFVTVPYVESDGPKSVPRLGMIFKSPNEREISRVYILPISLLRDYSMGQELFKLPFVRNRILKYPKDQLWDDVFRHRIEVKSKPLEEMIYDLYILYLRSEFLPKTTKRYGLLRSGKAIVELVSDDNDYIMELILNYHRGTVYSYILRTEKNNDESRKLRSKFIENISFMPADRAMGKFLYTEFKQLNFARQVDQEGMLYLFSSWSQDTSSTDMLREMIFFLERGLHTQAQLKPLYKFALKHYGKTFTTKKIFSDHEDPNVLLQRNIELEKLEKSRDAERTPVRPVTSPELPPEEKMNLYLKKVKEQGQSEKTDMTIH